MGVGGETGKLRAAARGVARAAAGLAIAAAGPLVAGAAPAAASEAPAVADNTATVRILADSLDPQTVEVEPGGTVVWVNESGKASSVMSTDSSIDSEEIANGDRYQFAFTEAGTITYTVKSLPGVTGTVVVRDAALANPVAPAATGTTAPGAAPQDFAYTGSGTAVTGLAGGLALALGAALIFSARRIGAVALSGFSYFFAPDDLLPSRRHRRALKARAGRARSDR